MTTKGAIGVFDSGYGGLTVLKELVNLLPQYDYIYLGDNARTPYGTRSFETVYQYTLECVQKLFAMGCPLIILACNTASAKALRTIQQNDLEKINPDNRVLGVIRPTSEIIGSLTKTNQVGILATNGTVQSNSYVIEIEKFFPLVQVHQEACNMWVPLIENKEQDSPGAAYFIQKNIEQLLQQNKDIDTILLGCTHYPLLANSIKRFLPDGIQLLSQGVIVANSLQDYLKRHTAIEKRLTQNANRIFYTTDAVIDFNEKAELFYGEKINAIQIHL
jgi:glutamate racemase